VNAAIISAQAIHEPRVSTRLMLRALLEIRNPEIRASLRACGADLDRLQNTVDGPAQHPRSKCGAGLQPASLEQAGSLQHNTGPVH